MGLAYYRTSGQCQRCQTPFEPDQVATMVREKLITDVIQGIAIYRIEWVAVCQACATHAEQAAAADRTTCRGCGQPLATPSKTWGYRTIRPEVCRWRCAQRHQRRRQRARRSCACRTCGRS